MRDETGRAVGFDMWVASRSPALTRFAYLLTGSEITAEAALSAGLARASLGWSRIRRADDPELEVCRLVVAAVLPRRRLPWRSAGRAVVRRLDAPSAEPEADDATLAWQTCAGLPAEQRVAVVLRCAQAMTYPQIASVVGVRESTAISLVGEGFAALADRLGVHRSDEQLERAFADCFALHADDLSDGGGRTMAARTGAGRLRRSRLMTATSIVAGVVVVAIAVTAVAYRATDGPPSGLAGAHPSGWRAESYDGVQLWVPPSWGWGEVPRRSGERLVTCGFGAYSATAITANLRYVRLGPGLAPYVGRPVAVAAGCPPMRATSAAHVWFDSPLEVGSDAGQTTVRVDGVTSFNVTVADPNQAERATILGSVEGVAVDANGCPRGPADLARLRPRAVAGQSPTLVLSVSLCLFATGSAGHEALFYSTRVEGRTAREVTASLEAVPGTTTPDTCLITPALPHAALIARSADAFSVFGVNTGACTERADTAGNGSRFHVLTAASVRLWALDGLAIYTATNPQDVRLTPLIPDL